MALTITESLEKHGVHAESLAKVVARGMRSSRNSLKAADMACKLLGLYRSSVIHSGQINHAHAHLDITEQETARRIEVLKQRAAQASAEKDALDVIVPPPTAPKGSPSGKA